MNWKTDPPRLRDVPDEMPDELASAMGDFGDPVPTAREIGALRANVRLALGLPLGGGPAHPPAASAASSSAAAPVAIKSSLTATKWVSWIVAPLGVGAVAGAVFVGTTNRSAPEASLAPIAAPVATATPSPRTDPIEAPRARPAEMQAPSPQASTPNENLAPIANAPHAAARLPSRAELPSAPLDLAPEPASGGYAAAAPVPAPETEVALLSRAQEALARDPARALELVGEHERRFDTGLLVQEREVIAVEALVKLGRTSEAATRAAAFHTRFPRSAHGRRVDLLVHAGPN
jgi:hypothetical protein